MRYGEDHKAETRERVVRAAANAMRRLGPDRVSVADVMSEVTFYDAKEVRRQFPQELDSHGSLNHRPTP